MSKQLSKHHIIPKSKGGSSNLVNIRRVTYVKHEAFNTLFGGNARPEEALTELVENWFYKDDRITKAKLTNFVKWLKLHGYVN